MALLSDNLNIPVLVFDPYGFHIDITGQPRAGTITVTDTISNQAQTIDITVAGALRIQRP